MILDSIKRIGYLTVQAFRIETINRRRKTSICSGLASAKAKYSEGVGIGNGTFVAANVSIGYHSYVNENSWIENCDIGNWCSISDHVMICPAEHHIEYLLSHPVLGCKNTKKVIIGNDVLVSHGVTVLQGVQIGDGAVVAAGAVVTKNIPPYQIWGGVPAHYIKDRFNKEQIEIIKRYNIYMRSENEILSMSDKLRTEVLSNDRSEVYR